MKFVDEAAIRVIAGKGGNGCLSFLREKFRPNGGPDGGDGGNGGSVYMIGKSGLNTLADFRLVRQFKAQSGESGAGKDRFGKHGADLYIDVPLGTIVRDAQSNEIIGDITDQSRALAVARGGKRGLGNANFKSSINRAPRRTTSGKPGDERLLRLELKVLADVGLLGLPNAGKSTFLSAVSQARPKIADYPFTTLYPQLGVVDIGIASSFVIADIPGLIEGAAEGVGLGTRFLRHLSRTRLLLHLVDVAPADGKDPIDAILEIEKELHNFDPALSRQTRWLVFTKIDTIGEELAEDVAQQAIKHLGENTKIHLISSVTGAGCQTLTNKIMQALNEIWELEQVEQVDPDVNSTDE